MQVTYNLYQDGLKIRSGIKDPTTIIGNAQPGSTHEYRVSAQTCLGESVLSNPLTVTFPLVTTVGDPMWP